MLFTVEAGVVLLLFICSTVHRCTVDGDGKTSSNNKNWGLTRATQQGLERSLGPTLRAQLWSHADAQTQS